MRVVSLLPSATESLFALGLGHQLVAVTHECDFPPEARELPCVTRSTLGLEGKQRSASSLDGSAYFNRPGPRLVDSLELLVASR